MRFASAQLVRVGFEYAACGMAAVNAITTTRTFTAPIQTPCATRAPSRSVWQSAIPPALSYARQLPTGLDPARQDGIPLPFRGSGDKVQTRGGRLALPSSDSNAQRA